MTKLTLNAIASITTAMTLVAGCGSDPEARTPPATPAAPTAPTTPGMPPGPVEVPEPPKPTARYSGVYAVVAPIDLTQNGVLPGVIGPALSALVDLHDHPGKSLLDIVAIANIPTVSDAVKGLPSFVRDLLAGLLDKVIEDEVYANVPVVEQITGIISGISDLAKTMEVHDTLRVPAPAADGSTTIDQQVTDVGFTLLGKKSVVSFNAGERAAAHSAMPGAIAAHANAPVADADLTLTGGKMTLPFGELLLQAAGPLLFSQFGGATDLNGALQNLVPCHAVAGSISDALDGYLSAALVENLCTAALGALAGSVTHSLQGIVLKDVQVSAGQAYLLDVSQSRPQTDYQSDRIGQGKWEWTFSLAGGSAKVPSTFEGERIGDIP